MKRTLIAILLALALVVIPVSSAFAATSANVTVEATPAYVSIDLGAVTDWTVNLAGGGLDFPAGDGVVRPNTTYYANPVGAGTDMIAPSNPVVAGECLFTFTNNGTVSIDITCNMSAFAGGDAVMTNTDTGYATNDTTKFGASGYKVGDAAMAAAVIFKTAASDEFVDNLLPGDLEWGVALKTRTDVFTGPLMSTSTIVCTAAEHTP